MEKIATINGQRIHYLQICVTDRPKDSLIFLHGWGGNGKSWEKNIPALSENYNCIVLDLPGFGVSYTPEELWGIPEYAHFLEEFTKTLKIENFSLIGKSFGGRVAIYFATIYPEKLNKLVLVSAAGIENRGLITRIKICFFKTGKFLLESLFNKKILRTEKFLNSMKGFFNVEKEVNVYKSNIKEKVLSLNLSAQAREIKLPTLIIWGSEDKVLPIEIGKKLNSLVQDSIFRIISHGGHNAHIDYYKEFNDLVCNFV